jgi:hypothetical protein
MATCYQHKIHYLYLPAHSSHLLQPLDLSPFSVTKCKYRQQIRDLSWLDDAAPVKKEKFLHYYCLARTHGLSLPVVLAGWRATGLVLYNPELVLSSSQVRTRPVTPPRALEPIHIDNLVCTTPHRSQDLYAASQLIGRSETLSRSTRFLLGKAGKAISVLNTRAAELQASNQRLQYLLSQSQIKLPRKRVVPNLNERFSDQAAIMVAVDQAAARVARTTKKRYSRVARKAANQSVATTFEAMCTEWQI